MRIRRRPWLAGIAVLLVAGMTDAKRHDDEPATVTVQHILIGFKRSVPGKKLDRTKDQARALAAELVERARATEDPAEFTTLVAQYTDDAAPGIYLLVNDDRPLTPGGRKRSDMVPRFGDVAFSLAVGEVGLAEYHAALSPFGWHVIKRLE